MSKANDIAQGMAERLATAAALAGVDIVVDRQLDIETIVAKRLSLAKVSSKSKGALATIFYQGFENPEPGTGPHPQITRTYLVSIYGAQILKDGNPPADDLVEAAAVVLHQWEPAEADGIAEIHVRNGVARPDADYLIYDLEVRVQSRL